MNTEPSDLSTIPLNLLRLSEANTRTVSPANIEAMAASIRVQGLIQNLVVTKGKNGGGEVIAGGRRLRAMELLVEQGHLPADWPVSCRVVAAGDATALSLAENVQREAMHPADEVEAFQRLRAENWSIDRIADAFGVTPLVVERRLRLADVSARAETLAATGQALAKELPKANGALWDALAALTDADLDQLVAFGVASSLSLADGHKGLTGQLLDALDFDMSTHFSPTAETYLARVSKGIVLSALAEAGVGQGSDALAVMKKGDLVAEAQRRLEGSGWVPQLIRTPRRVVKPATSTKAKAPKAPAGKKRVATKAQKTPAGKKPTPHKG